MTISIIAAIATNRVIGRGNQLPWHLPADLKHFRATTYGHPIIMGRNTCQAIGKALPGRENIVLTRAATYLPPAGCKVAHTLEQALSYARKVRAKHVFVIGGSQVYAHALPVADDLYLTHVHAEVVGDVLFPPIDMMQWKEVSRADHPADDSHAYAYSFVRYIRNPV